LCCIKYADDDVLLPKEEMVVQSMIDGLTEIGNYCGMEMHVENNKVMRISR
jgi:hypothetical protein